MDALPVAGLHPLKTIVGQPPHRLRLATPRIPAIVARCRQALGVAVEIEVDAGRPYRCNRQTSERSAVLSATLLPSPLAGEGLGGRGFPPPPSSLAPPFKPPIKLPSQSHCRQSERKIDNPDSDRNDAMSPCEASARTEKARH